MTPRPPGRSERAVVPSVGKALEASVVLLYVALLSTALYGGVVPDYRATAGAELADRTLATAANEVRSTVPPPAAGARAERRVDLPATIAGEGYQIRAEDGRLVLEHPDGGVGGAARLALPAHVDRVEGEWHSRGPTWVRVVPADDGVVVRLVNEPPTPRHEGGERR